MIDDAALVELKAAAEWYRYEQARLLEELSAGGLTLAEVDAIRDELDTCAFTAANALVKAFHPDHEVPGGVE